MWDDGLVAAWKKDQRLVLLMAVEEYPPHVDKIKYWLGFHRICECAHRIMLRSDKPPQDIVIATTRGQGLPPFFLSSPLLSYLKSFGRCFKLRTGYGLNWSAADAIGLDHERSRQVFHDGQAPEVAGVPEVDDPVAKGYEDNILLCVFHWVLRRFMEASSCCLVSPVSTSWLIIRTAVCRCRYHHYVRTFATGRSAYTAS